MSGTQQTLLDHAKALEKQGRFNDALAVYQQAIGADPTSPQGYLQLGGALFIAGFQAEANRVFEIGCGEVPGSPVLNWAHCMSSLPMIYADEAEMARARSDFSIRLHALRELCFASMTSLTQSVEAVGILSPFFLSYQGQNETALHALHGRLVSDIMAANFPQYTLPLHRPWTLGEPIRVGIVSGLFWRHAVWRMPIRGWVENLDRSRFHLTGYHTRPERDDQTDYAKRCFDRFVQGSMPVAEWAGLITRDAPHVLIYPELANVQAGIQLAALRLAPVQCTSWGQPITTGLPTIDYYLSSDLMEPPDGDTHYTESLVRLPGLGVVLEADYAAWGEALPATDIWATPELPPDAVRIVCCQSLTKYLPMFDDLFPRIALDLPAARFLFINTQQRGAEILARRLDAAFARFGLASGVHCRFVGTLSPSGFSAMIRDAHIFLDTPVWSGCNTTLDAFGHRIPIVAMPGDFMRGRHSLAILTKAGVTDTIAHSLDEYVAITVRLGRDPAWRADVGSRLAAGAAQVFGDVTPVRALEDFLTAAVVTANRA